MISDSAHSYQLGYEKGKQEEREKVLSEVEKALDGLDCGFCNYGDEVKSRLAELRTKLAEMKARE